MIQRFLKAKHWQLFLATFGTMIIIQIIAMTTIISLANSTQFPDSSTLFSVIPIFPIAMLLIIAIHWGWTWSVGVGLQDKIPAHIEMKVKKFKFFFFFPMVYIALLFICIPFFINGIDNISESNIGIVIGSVFAVIFPLHIFAMFCSFYTLYFISKTIKTVELQREVSFSDFIGEFFLIWFFPIGIWIIQPKLNQLATKTDFEQEYTF